MVKPGKKQKVVEEEEEVEEEVEITQADFNEIGKLVVQGATLTKIKVAFPKIPPAVLKEAVEAFKQKGKKKVAERNAPLPNPKPEANFERQVPGNIFSFFSLSSQIESFPLLFLVPVFIPLKMPPCSQWSMNWRALPWFRIALRTGKSCSCFGGKLQG